MLPYNLEKKRINYQINSLKNKKIDPNNIVLNAAAFQDQISQKFGTNLNRYRKITSKKFFINSKPKSCLSNKKTPISELYAKKDTEKEILNRNKKFLSKLTFCEKVGLQKIKNFPLSLEEWKQVEAKTIKREDFKGDCPICMDKLSNRESVILSCSHVFHKVCLKNFERFSAVTKCPLCRCERYECKTYTKDKEYFVKKSVDIIQRNIRGYLTRYKLYKKIFKNNMPKSKRLRNLYSYWKMRDLTDKMMKEIQRQNEINQEFFNDVLKEHEELIRMENKEKEMMEKNKKDKNKTDWDNVVNKMEDRNNHTCAICLCEFKNKPLYVLDCTHCFHKNCLDSFERFDPYYIKRCPICRANYTKKEMKLANDGKYKEDNNIKNDKNKYNNKNINNKGNEKSKSNNKPIINKEHPLYNQYKEFMILEE
jgi:hypothetical protein